MAVSTSPQLAPHEEGGSDQAELNLRILHSLALWVKETAGEAALKEVAAAGDARVDDLAGGSVWTSSARFERILAAAAKYAVGEDQFRAACAHRLHESYGPLLLLLKAASPTMVFRHAGRSFGTISAISTVEIESRGRTTVNAVYRSTKRESRLMCLSRQGQMASLPTLWGLPSGTLLEKQCIARGDTVCEYEVRLHASHRWLPIIVSAVLGVAMWGVAAVAHFDNAHWLGVLVTATLSASAYALEQRKANVANTAFAQDAQMALGVLAADEEEVRRELAALQGRQRDWLRRVEQELDARSAALAEMSGVGEKRLQVLRGQVHDLRTMLTVVRYALEASETNSRSEEESAAVDDGREALAKIDRILRQAMQQWEPGRALVALEPRRVEVEPFSAGLRRRLGALAHGTQLRVAVHTTREAPSSIVTDPLLVDRVLDNLLGNAVKYTARGSVNVEVGGAPGFLTVKIADTGPGIGSERFNQVFRPGGSLVDERVDGFGVGLSIVVQLLAQIGGRLEVMSTPPDGTTFWVFIPIELAPPATPRLQETNADGDADRLFEQVVRVHGAN